MTIRDIIKIGNPFLLKKTHEVKNFSDGELQVLIKDLIDTQKQSKGVGLAAPQIGSSLRVITIGFDKNNKRYQIEEGMPHRAFINIHYHPIGNETELGWEGCLSIPNMRGLVERYKTIEYTAYNEHGKFKQTTVSGFLARVIQHETDHLDGILFLHRLNNPLYFGTTEELQAINFDISRLTPSPE
jgi:peptide deformylase